MNKVFKVVFNAVRNKMMVVNEMTSSMQAGRKKARVAMVVGAALLGLGGAVNAAVITSAPADDNPEWKWVSGYYVPNSDSQSEHEIKLTSPKDINKDFAGGFIKTGSESVTSNRIQITAGKGADTRVYGGMSNGSGDVLDNQIEIVGNNSNPLTGAFNQVFGGVGKNNVENNEVHINAPDVTFTFVFGGKVSASNGTAQNNTVEIIDGTFTSSIAGGYSGEYGAESTSNNVIIRGGTFGTVDKPCIIAGGVDKDSSATGNSVTVADNPNFINASLYGGLKEGTDYGVYSLDSSPNTLNIGFIDEEGVVHPWKGTVKSIQGFDVINFKYLEWNTESSAVVTENLALNPWDGTAIIVDTINVASGGIVANDSMTLIAAKKISGKLNTDKSSNSVKVKINEGIATTYEGVSCDIDLIGTRDNRGVINDGAIVLTINDNVDVIQSSMNEQILVLGESRAAATAFTNQATDLIDSTLDDLGQKATLGMSGFAAIHGNASEYETGSHVDVNGWSMIVGASSKLENGTTVGAFFETGTGNYRTFNDLDGVTMRGDGESTYWGGGLMARHAFDNGFYAEGSVRVGQLKNKLENAVKGSEGLTGYDIDTVYAGAHIGAGKVFELNSAGDNVDVYGKFLYTYNEGKNFAIDGDSVNYSSVTSERLRLGARYTKNVNDKLQAKVGAAWEYDFNGDSKNTVANYDLGTPSLGGSTYMADVGVRYQATDNVAIDFSGRGYTGKREGVSGQINVKFSF